MVIGIIQYVLEFRDADGDVQYLNTEYEYPKLVDLQSAEVFPTEFAAQQAKHRYHGPETDEGFAWHVQQAVKL